ncbi:MAG: 4-(cytidine 5'-diphospho)-2-C-methyl-D-erythritol kinase [Terracidiphilus sp.]
MPTAVRSHAKINLGLFLGPPREDGFHALTTVYQTLEMHDVVTVTARQACETKLQITSNDSRVPNDSRNTAWKMVTQALDSLRVSADVSIHIEKRLPVQGGLGAGSANAIAALMGLENELDPLELDSCGDLAMRVFPLARPAEKPGNQTPPPTAEDIREMCILQLIAAELKWAEQVGSDVPLFLLGGTVLGVDRGQRVFPLPDIEPVWCVVVVPEIGVSTPLAFRDWDALCAAEGLTAESGTAKLEKLSRAYARAFREEIPDGQDAAGSSGVFSAGEDLAGPQESALVRTGITSWIENDFERVVFPQHPSLAEIKRLLLAPGTPEAALFASLSGSGSALFGLYRTRGDGEAAEGRISRAGPELGVQSTTITRTLPRVAYWEQMLERS